MWQFFSKLLIIILLCGCTTSGSDIRVTIPTHTPPAGISELSKSSQASFRIETIIQTLSPGELPSRIGERKTLGNISMGMVDIEPTPSVLLHAMLRTELIAAGHHEVQSGEQVVLSGDVTRFELRTDVTTFYWDIVVDLNLTVKADARSGVKTSSHYISHCSERTYTWPSEELIEKVVQICIDDLSTQFREDTNIASVFAAEEQIPAR